MNEKKKKLLEVFQKFHVGAGNACSINRLSVFLGINRSSVRNYLFELREGQIPLCSNSNGYYLASTQEELDETIAFLSNRTLELQRAVEALKQAIPVASHNEDIQ